MNIERRKADERPAKPMHEKDINVTQPKRSRRQPSPPSPGNQPTRSLGNLAKDKRAPNRWAAGAELVSYVDSPLCAKPSVNQALNSYGSAPKRL